MGSSIFLIFLLFFTSGNGDNKKIDSEWWKNAVIYQIYPKSFQSTTGKGTGDLKGIISRLDYIVDLGVDAIWLSPIYESKSNADGGYDISDFKSIDPKYGNMDDFKELVTKTHDRNIKIIMDFVPNHSSDQHDWFIRSLKGEAPYKDYYVWKDYKRDPVTQKLIPPNNWLSVTSQSAWKNTTRNQFYLHQFLVEQPDLNYNNPQVLIEMQNVLKFWLDLGVDGFRMDAVGTLCEDPLFRDEPPLNRGTQITDYDSMNHIYTQEQDKTYEVLAAFRQVLDDYTKEHGGNERIMFTESYTNDINKLRRYYGSKTKPISHFPFNFLLLENMKPEHLGIDWFNWINKWYKDIPMSQYWPNWVMGNHDRHRISSRFSREHTDIITLALMSLPGTYISYYGDELALEDSMVRRDQANDTLGLLCPPEQFHDKSRDFERGPMPWDNSDNGGFSSNRPWLPLSSNREVNVQAQQSDKKSHLRFYQSLVKMRKTYFFKRDHVDFKVETPSSSAPEVLIITRSIQGKSIALTVVNFGKYPKTVDLSGYKPPKLKFYFVYAASPNSAFESKTLLTTNVIVLPPISGVSLTISTSPY